jgi:hypothetical protein
MRQKKRFKKFSLEWFGALLEILGVFLEAL